MSTQIPSSVAGLYVHVPFCRRACPYCDFDFVVGRMPEVDGWIAGLEREWELRAPQWQGRPFDTLYLGGGTPSLLGGAGLQRLGAFLERRFGARLGHAERTCELNPEDVDADLVDALRALNVGRVSVGVQSFSDGGLRQLGRAHDGEAADAALELLSASGFELSVDLIAGWPGQGIDALERDLERVLAHEPAHVSVYALTIEAESQWPRLVSRGLRVLPDDDTQAELLLHAERILGRRGFVHYEISSYARPGRVARHNAKYWGGIDYLGLGPSAASMRDVDGAVLRRTNRRGLAHWIGDPGAPAHHEDLRGESAAGEALWLGLRRLDRGVTASRITGHGVDEAWIRARIARQVDLGNLQFDGKTVRVSPGRWLFHQAIGFDLV